MILEILNPRPHGRGYLISALRASLVNIFWVTSKRINEATAGAQLARTPQFKSLLRRGRNSIIRPVTGPEPVKQSTTRDMLHAPISVKLEFPGQQTGDIRNEIPLERPHKIPVGRYPCSHLQRDRDR